MIIIFCSLMRHSVIPTFTWPKGGVARQVVFTCLEVLRKEYAEISEERIIDYCVCQIYAISRFDKEYLNHRWNITHSFGKKAICRFQANKQGNRYYEDKWLKDIGLSRNMLLEKIQDRKKHPLFRYINPEYEEATKARALSTTAGYYICAASTLLWNPYSASCSKCSKQEACIERTRMGYPELYRIRTEEFNKMKK